MTKRTTLIGSKRLEVAFETYKAGCPKCGSEDQHRAYHATTHGVCDLFEFEPDCCTFEHFCMTCRDCGFEWVERIKKSHD